MHGAGRDEDGLSLGDRDRLAFDVEDAAALEHDVELVVGVRLLVVGLGGDEYVDADLEAGRGVHHLVAAVPGLEPPPNLLDLEGVGQLRHRTGCSIERLPLRVVSSISQRTSDSTESTPGTRVASRPSSSASVRRVEPAGERDDAVLHDEIDSTRLDPHRLREHVLAQLTLDLRVRARERADEIGARDDADQLVALDDRQPVDPVLAHDPGRLRDRLVGRNRHRRRCHRRAGRDGLRLLGAS